MGTIIELLEGVQKLNLMAEMPIIIENTSGEIIKLNQGQLYYSGENSKGQKLQGYYFAWYERMKAAMNPNLNGEAADLFLSGDFYGGFYVKVDKNVFEVSSSDRKTTLLTGKYSEDIFGLSDESLTEYSLGIVLDAIQLYISQVTGLTFER